MAEAQNNSRSMVLDRLSPLLEQAQKGDAAATAQAREILANDPELWDRIGNFATEALSSWIIASVGETNIIAQDAVRHHLDKLRRELGNKDATRLERLLISRVVMTWLQVHHAETIYARGMHSMSLALQDFHQRRITQSQRRYLAAIRTLATVRRLLVPRLPDVRIDQVGQLNVGQHQTNGASPPARVIGSAR